MRDIDGLIDQALDEEERELLRSMPEEPGFFGQVFSVFHGPDGWVGVLMMVVQSLLSLAGAWAAWCFFNTTDVLTALRWGLPASVLLICALAIKLSMWPTIQANRVLRELKRFEWQMSRRQGGRE